MPNSKPTPRVRVGNAASSWLPKLPLSKLTAALLPLILFFSATQLGFHFWPPSAFVYGVRVDYLSPTLYLVDLLIIGYLIARMPVLVGRPLRVLLTLLPLLLLNLFFSLNPLATLVWSLRLTLYSLFIFTFPSFLLSTFYFLLPLAMLFQLILGFLQVVKGGALQGPFYFLGERAFSLGSPNVASGSLLGETILRAYGTFSHPNVLAGWLVIALLITYRLIRSRNLTLSLSTLYFLLSTLIASFGVFLTHSRAAALALFVFIVPFYFFSRLRSRLLYFLFLLSTFYFLLSTSILSRPVDTSLTDRLSLTQLSFQAIQAYPLFGIGAGASISAYPALAPTWRLLQPDHNSFTLFLSWFGLAGVIALISSLRRPFRLHPLLPLLPLLLLDHYLLTSPQGLFILLLYIRVTISYAKFRPPAHSL